MKRLLLLTVLLVGCNHEPAYVPDPPIRREYPVVNLPLSLRQANWVGEQREGSCVHATMVMLFRWQGRDDLASFWRRSYANGEWADRLNAKLDRNNVRYAVTTSGDVSFLEWACSTRRGCGITVDGGRHMVTLVHLDELRAGILDNNDIHHIRWVWRGDFINEWKNAHGWAVAILCGSPAPPLPTRTE